MGPKMRILLLVMLVLGFVSVVSDSNASLQQTMGVIIAVFILHFYLQKNFDDLQNASEEKISSLEKAYKKMKTSGHSATHNPDGSAPADTASGDVV